MIDAIALTEIAKSLPPAWRPVFQATKDQGVLDQILAEQTDLLAFVRAFPTLLASFPPLWWTQKKELFFSVLTADYTVPDISVSLPASVTSTMWMTVGDVLSVGTGTTFAWQMLVVDSIIDSLTVGFTNIGCYGTSVGQVVPLGQFVKYRVP